MGVYFVLRSHYEGPTGFFVRHFDDVSILGWFQNRWAGTKPGQTSLNLVRALVGTDVYGFGSLFEAIAENNLPVPQTDTALIAILNDHLYAEGEVVYENGALRVLTDDDELELAYFFFDDGFAAAHPERTAFPLHNNWRLPDSVPAPVQATSSPASDAETTALPPANGEGTLYLAFLSYYDSGNLSDLTGAYRIDGARLSDLPRYLELSTSSAQELPFEMRLLRIFIPIQDDTPNGVGISDIKQEVDDTSESLSKALLRFRRALLPHPGDTRLGAALRCVGSVPITVLSNKLWNKMVTRSAAEKVASEWWERDNETHRPHLQAGITNKHMVQMCLHTDTWGQTSLYHRWIFFDDVWQAANPDMAAGILACAATWDILS